MCENYRLFSGLVGIYMYILEKTTHIDTSCKQPRAMTGKVVSSSQKPRDRASFREKMICNI